MRTLIAAALVAAFLLPGPGAANHTDRPIATVECWSPSAVEFDVLSRNAGTRLVADLSGAEAAAFMETFNAIPPRTAYPYIRVQVFWGTTPAGRPYPVLVVFFDNDPRGLCAVRGTPFPVDVFRRHWPHLIGAET